jgi:hypothetical protein
MTIFYKVKLAFISLSLISATICFSQTAKFQEEKELEVVNFSSIQKVLKKDGLSQSAEMKKKQVSVMKTEQKNLDRARYNYPTEDEIWGLATDYWLIKNAQVLGWDFEKPDFGIENSFKGVLENLGFYQKKFKILVLNTSSIIRGALPGLDGEIVYIISLPFIRSLDLSKLEIALFLLEDYFRYEAGYFKKAVVTEKLKKMAGSSFYEQKVDLSLMEELVKNYGQQIENKGFSFQQQFETTKKMDTFLKSHPEFWNVYFRLLGKIQNFVKTNHQYKDYIKLYPSPEMQLKWLSPDEKAL